MRCEASECIGLRGRVGLWTLQSSAIQGSQALDGARVNVCEGLQIADGNALINLVNGRVAWSQFNDLGADGGDEATVAGAACCGQLGRDPRRLQNGRLDFVQQSPWRTSEWMATDGPLKIVFQPVFVQDAMHSGLQ